MILQDWQSRVIEEQMELSEKIARLDAFIEMNGHDHLMERQLFIMREYDSVLKARIKQFGI